MRTGLIMIIITAISICLFIPETASLPAETDYTNTQNESETSVSASEEQSQLSEKSDIQTPEASYADIVLEEAFRAIRADYHTFVTETKKDESVDSINHQDDSINSQDGDSSSLQDSTINSSVTSGSSNADSDSGVPEAEAMQPEATNGVSSENKNAENNTSQASQNTYCPELNCGINDYSTVSVYIHGSEQTVQMSLHDYVTGVVASEMPIYFDSEAIRAQAIAARTYAIYKIISNQDSNEHPGIYLCDATSHCCAYTSKSSSYDKWGESGSSIIQTSEAAVYDTENKVITYDGSCICAVWHSSSVNQTKNAKDVWGSPVAYLCSVPTFEKDRSASGHGVGMSQYGANDMASQGFCAEEILQHYYTGCLISLLK